MEAQELKESQKKEWTARGAIVSRNFKVAETKFGEIGRTEVVSESSKL